MVKREPYLWLFTDSVLIRMSTMLLNEHVKDL